jgi:hypothetical protein
MPGLCSRGHSIYLAHLAQKTEKRKQITIAPTADPLGAAIKCCNSRAKPNSAGAWHRRDEPAWHDPYILMKVCGNLGCSIQNQIGRHSRLIRPYSETSPCSAIFSRIGTGKAHRRREILRQTIFCRQISPQQMFCCPSAPVQHSHLYLSGLPNWR